MRTETISIIGLGREGASIGLAIKGSNLEVRVIGHDRDSDRARDAMKAGAVDQVERNLGNAASAAEILVLTVPASELELNLKVIGEIVRSETLVLDLSRGKAAGLKWAETYLQQGHYVGASLALSVGALFDGRVGPEAASAGLFHDSVLCLMPSPKANPKAVETAVNLGYVLGAQPYFVDTQEFDSLAQGIETTPGLLAAAMFSAIHKATGWRDMLRFAGLPFAQITQPLAAGPEIAQLALDNQVASLRWLDALLEELSLVRRWIHEGESELLAAALTELDTQREKWLHERAKNDWIEVTTPRYEGPSFTQQMLGGLAPGRDRDKPS